MKRALSTALVLALSLGAFAPLDSARGEQDKGSDKTANDKAPNVARKALAEIQKKKSAAISETAQFALGPQKVNNTFDGILRKDFAAVKGSAEVYARGATYLVNTGARFDPPSELQGQEATTAQSFKNPSILFEELGKLVASASFGGDEPVDGKDCRIVDFVADAALVKQHLKELGDRLNNSFKGFGGGFGGGIIDFKAAFDEKATIATYRVSVGKSDLVIYRVEFVIKPKVKPNALPKQIPFPTDLDQRLDVKFSKWDEDVPFEIPSVIKTKWGLK